MHSNQAEGIFFSGSSLLLCGGNEGLPGGSATSHLSPPCRGDRCALLNGCWLYAVSVPVSSVVTPSPYMSRLRPFAFPHPPSLSWVSKGLLLLIGELVFAPLLVYHCGGRCPYKKVPFLGCTSSARPPCGGTPPLVLACTELGR